MTISNAGWRDRFAKWSAWWQSNRPGKWATYRFMWIMIASADELLQAALMGVRAAWPGAGTPTALPMIGRTRGLIRGMADTDASYAAYLRSWFDLQRIKGSQLALAKAIQHYCAGMPKVKVVNRAGRMLALNSDGTWAVQQVTWTWDNTSHPWRSTYWSEQWVIVYTPPWAIAAAMGTNTPADCGIGQLCPRVDVNALKGLFAEWKAAHSYIRAVLWAYDATLFDPTMPATMPDGTWGSWSYGAVSCQLSGRGVLEQQNKLRTWEPDQEPGANFVGFGARVNA